MDSNMEVLIKTEDAIDAYNGAANLARSLGVSRAAISQWGEYVPEVSARGLVILQPSIPHIIKKPSAT
ncbi:putative bacteriophage regulatory protein [Acinetobacter baumannii SDF]|uniref:Bacteriophage regulatory protein n=1 Tax=Acinetobacter baumannii (strain SDF) TaxID=509170 RepID=B0VSZ4_ACIBS|nr:putative bacteriophage regulatory protein [Acinetobacter baumannii SDF]